MSTTYKALIHESTDSTTLTLKDLPIPSPLSTGSVLVQPLFSNLASYARCLEDGKYMRPISFPFVPGHSCVARIEAVPPDATKLKPGDIVWVDSLIVSRDDPDAQFLIGFWNGTTPGPQKLSKEVWSNGCFAEKVVVPLENCFVLPPSLFQAKNEGGLGYEVKDMAALSFILVCFAGLVEAGVGVGKTVIIAPATGKFSGGAVLAALALGAKVVAASRNAEKLATLYSLPYATERLSTVQMTGDTDTDAAALLKATGGDGRGAHLFMDVTPPLPTTTTPTHFTAALRALR
ncbi:GroES-like protein [Byssothecium circinans]|uniref:GroES-like protein n=1 Tax=Byssothecium circinans TaxID=147558 RepID=A0A6A5TGD3_9PLEO|nr:GroES-like protein [Byssothecium circinans]